ncbi:acetyltransferase [Clostridium estertheticum]|uniref:DapH/DapD/GlmU-related protein n=1 Tax=Clostridium estertheticum TaxID=238834 RepID=UPI001C0E80B6|nr:DapH/DapD/GlmU-related protein [Clostridium estertheticum]MBU3213952.1 acetyltransferase [Clostridium estertheticum]WAG53829.1 acetyltransferase [Clostridium estertheticum]
MKNGYGLGEIFKNAISLVYTKIFYRGARLIRRPIYVRGKKFLQYGEGITTGYNCRIEIFDTGVGGSKKLIIGKNCKIGDHVHIAAGEKVSIGDNCLMASKIYISDINHGDYSNADNDSSPDISPDNRPLYTKTVAIGNNVWIGENVCILPGVTIGDGCIIGANSVVNRNAPQNCMVAGSPARVIKKYNGKIKQWIKI